MPGIFRPAKRMPRFPDRAEIDESELADYDLLVAHIASGFSLFKDAPEYVAGVEFGVHHFQSLGVSPPLGAGMSRMGPALMRRQGRPGTFSAADHEMIDLVLAFDSGYWALIAGHVPKAMGAGIRIEAIEALRDGREEALTSDERQQVEFIRAVRDGHMTDEIWDRMAERLGTARGVVELTHFVCNLLFHHRYMWACGVPEMEREALDEMLAAFKDGRRSIDAAREELEKMVLNWQTGRGM